MRWLVRTLKYSVLKAKLVEGEIFR